MIEHVRSVANIVYEAEHNGMSPDEFVRRRIQYSLSEHNPLLNPDHGFVVIGIDEIERSMFPCESFPDAKSALEHVRKRAVKEPILESDTPTFHVFTMDGEYVLPPETP